ncbi:hypothetical protein F5884DRAFT_756755 [Xylogone sp. PMI_703]|nr:hypothetical protein F5884DRAFT_756755 [Xylogone sp. PMI_703]
MTEKRRIQNRIAQRNYREKERLRVAELERSATLNTSIPRNADSDTANSVTDALGDQLYCSYVEDSGQRLTFKSIDRQPGLTTNRLEANYHVDVPLGPQPSASTDSYSYFTDNSIISRDVAHHAFLDKQISGEIMHPQPYLSSVHYQMYTPNLNPPNANIEPKYHIQTFGTGKITYPTERNPSSVDTMSNPMTIYPFVDYGEPFQTLVPPGKTKISSPSHMSDDRQLSRAYKQRNSGEASLVWEAFHHIFRLDSTEDAQQLFKIALEHKLNARDVFLCGLYAIHNDMTLNLGAIFVSGLRFIENRISLDSPLTSQPWNQTDPSPNDPKLHLHRLSTLDAFLYNANAIGMEAKEFYGNVCSSPFYRANINSPDSIAELQATLSENIPSYLRPTPTQILHPHHPFLDILPFPTMRSRAISLSSQLLIDIVDLKRDIMKDGLVCWKMESTYDDNAVDARSWEAMPWFRMKWWILLGEKAGETWIQSK